MTRLHVVGVRHHSPACARLVAHTLERVRPEAVLIEGPADMNGRLGELLLPHRLPVAVFSFRRVAAQGAGGDRTESCWSPFCEYSPEWVALTGGQRAGALVRFMDLPAWHEAFFGVANRYGDHERRHDLAVKALCRRLHLEGYDALWDHLFEGPPEDADGEAELERLALRLRAYFQALRHGDPGERDRLREAYMGRWVRAALARVSGPVMVVCGGYHAPVLEPLEAATGPGAGEWPEVPGGGVAQSYLVPWSYRRLDAFGGYESGMPSPAYYEEVFRSGAAGASDRALRVIVEHLRGARLAVSAADLIAARTLAQGLARLRGHRSVLRTDLLDGLAGALVKESLDAPLPWAERGVLRQGTQELLVEVLRSICGEREGELHADTPRPGLLADVRDTLTRHGLLPAATARTVRLQLAEGADRERSRVLHRLRVLEVPGFQREHGPAWTTDAVLEELWVVAKHDRTESALIEAASFGATLEGAAGRRLEERLLAADLDLEQTTRVLGEAVFIGLDSLTALALGEVRRHASRETDLARLGAALSRLLGLFTQDVLFGARGRPELAAALSEAFARGLWLLENLGGTAVSADGGPVGAVRALRDCARETVRLGLPPGSAQPVFGRRAHAPDAPPDVRGACLGALWSLGELGDAASAQAAAVRAVQQAALPATFGDFLVGLFALAREEVVAGVEVLTAVDQVVEGLAGAEFLEAVPSLRLAFSWFPPREKAAIAERIAALHGRAGAGAELLQRLEASVAEVTRGRALDTEVELAMRRWGLLPSSGPP